MTDIKIEIIAEKENLDEAIAIFLKWANEKKFVLCSVLGAYSRKYKIAASFISTALKDVANLQATIINEGDFDRALRHYQSWRDNNPKKVVVETLTFFSFGYSVVIFWRK